MNKKYAQYKGSKACIISIPYEHTVSFMAGCDLGPSAVLHASANVELYDEELQFKPHIYGISHVDVADFSEDHDANLKYIGKEFLKHYKSGKFIVSVGGEHSITIGLLEGLKQVEEDVSIIQFDAHADLRSFYPPSKKSHACVMRRASEMFPNTLALGIRSMGEDAASYIKKNDYPILYAKDLFEMSDKEVQEYLSKVIRNKKVYITFDVDVFDASVVSLTGTPEPGGLGWYQTLRILKHIFKKYDVIAVDVVELIGRESPTKCAFNTALLIRKMLGYKFLSFQN
ncbi:MAG TPA: agmatinase [bacterium]|nr:agmatinase [bacterium]